MPETIRAANEKLRSRPRRGGFLAAFVIANLTSSAFVAPAHADAPRSALAIVGGLKGAVANIAGYGIGTLSLTFGLVCLAVLATIALLRARRQSRTPQERGGQRGDAAQRRDRPAEGAAVGGAAGAGGMAGGLRPADHSRRHLHHPARRRSRARARLRHLAGAHRRPAHGARRADPARRGPRFRDDAHQRRRPPGRSGRPRGGRPRGACGCATSAASSRSWSISPSVTTSCRPTSPP